MTLVRKQFLGGAKARKIADTLQHALNDELNRTSLIRDAWQQAHDLAKALDEYAQANELDSPFSERSK